MVACPGRLIGGSIDSIVETKPFVERLRVAAGGIGRWS